jgi:hypothetical protein
MRTWHRRHALRFFHAGICALFACAAHALDLASSDDVTAVSSRTSKDYVRLKNKDGSYPVEYYAFAEGGPWKGAMKDYSIDRLTFLDVAHVMALPLAAQNFIPCKDTKGARLLVLVYWGTTHADNRAEDSISKEKLQDKEQSMKTATDERDAAFKVPHGSPLQTLIYDRAYESVFLSAQAQLQAAVSSSETLNTKQDQNDLLNVKMLGYDSWWNDSIGDLKGTALSTRRDDLIREIEENRYFVILMAYDFQLLWKQKKHKLLWETRFSVRQRGHEFDRDLPAIAQYASQFFGQDTGGLIHMTLPAAHVEIGDVKALGTVSGK